MICSSIAKQDIRKKITGGENNSQKTKTYSPTHLYRLPHRATKAVNDPSS